MMDIKITEEEINRTFEEDILDTMPVETILNETTPSRFVEFTLGERGWDAEVNTHEINMNPYSLSFFVKSLFCGNSGAVYMSTFINFFQELDISTLGNPNFYSTCSHAATLYILKALEKNGVVKIVEYTTAKTENHTIFDRAKKKTKLKMYDVLFYKLRDLKKEDSELIREIERTLRISKRQIRIRFFEGEMYIRLGILEVIKCIFTGHIFIQFKKNLTYWTKADGFKNDLANVLYNLKRANKSTIK